jgi:hypothetical protein
MGKLNFLLLGPGCIGLLIFFAFWGSIVLIAWHFIAKFW